MIKTIKSPKYNSKSTIVKRLLENSKIDHSKGYVADIESNLLSTIKEAYFIDDLESGNGNELNSKFKALYSSSALGVNFFGLFKQQLDKFTILGESNFKVGRFEKNYLLDLEVLRQT